ncbi:TPA: glycosyltransferase, partial [Escherichia coli]|nr:glycosyltransferase [Escherichia coli]
FLSQPITGVQKFCHQQLSKLAKTHDVTVLLPKNADASLLPGHVKFVYVGKLTGHFWEQIELPLFLYRKKNALLMSFSGLSPILYNNSIFTVHDLSFVENPKWFSLPYRIWYGFAYSLLSRTCQRVITVSNFSKTEILKKYPRLKDRIDVVYNISPEIDDSEPAPQGISYGKYILLVSSLDPRKNR